MAIQLENEAFRSSYSNFLLSVNQPLRVPKFAGKQLDLCELFKDVKKLGGYDAVGRAWRKIAKKHGYDYGNANHNTGGTSQIRNVYKSCLLAYEDNLTRGTTGRQVDRTAAHDVAECGMVFGLAACQCHALDALFSN